VFSRTLAGERQNTYFACMGRGLGKVQREIFDAACDWEQGGPRATTGHVCGPNASEARKVAVRRAIRSLEKKGWITTERLPPHGEIMVRPAVVETRRPRRAANRNRTPFPPPRAQPEPESVDADNFIDPDFTVDPAPGF
jgi:hypothetical protein